MKKFKVLILVLSLALPVVVLADAEVLVPPGTADEIIASFSFPNRVTQRDRIIQTGIKEVAQKPDPRQTGVNKKKLPPPVLPPKAPPPMTVSLEELLGVAAADFDIEFSHLAQMPMDPDPIVEHLGYKQDDYEVIKGRCDVHFKCFTRILMRLFHNNRMLDKEDMFYFTLYGEPAGTFSNSRQRITSYENGDISGFCKQVLDYIKPETKKVELPTDVGDPYDLMVQKLAVLELANYYPFTVSSPFAPGLDFFSHEELYKYLKPLIMHPNKRVSRNAVYYLGMMQRYEPLEDLLRVLKMSQDNVEKCRALFLLTAARFEGLDDFIIDRLPSEKDEIFELAMINSLRRLKSKKAFKVLADKFLSPKNDFSYYFAVVRASAMCLEKKDKKTFQKFYDKCKEVYGIFKNAPQQNLAASDIPELKMCADPTPPVGGAPSYKYMPRMTALRQALQILMALCGDQEASNELQTYLEQKVKTYKPYSVMLDFVEGSPNPFGGGGQETGPGTSNLSMMRVFVGEVMPMLGSYAKDVLEKLILIGADNDYVIYPAIDSYAEAYPDGFSKFGVEVLKSDVRVTVKDRILKKLYISSFYDDNVKKALKEIISKYRPDMKDEEKHIVSLAVFYMSAGGDLASLDKKAPEKWLFTIIENEKIRGERKPEFSQKAGIFYIKFPRINNLLEVAIESLGSLKIPKVEEYLINLSKMDSPEVKLKLLVVKTLGNFRSEAIKERLFNILDDKDPWVRLAAYLSLNRITKVDHKVDWYFSRSEHIAAFISEYREKIKKITETQ
ncbi:MAG: HEAT repeat domain-containing protein [Planctomycetes bacterium]|nr:HEAT repeat domain-containing protein [Planctomycetota bacterium]